MDVNHHYQTFSCPADLGTTLLFSYGKSPLPMLIYPPEWLLYPIATPPASFSSSLTSNILSLLKSTVLLCFLAVWLFLHARVRGKTRTAPKMGSAAARSSTGGRSSRAVTTLRKQDVSLRSGASAPPAPAPPPPPGTNQMKLSSLSVGSMKTLGKESRTGAPRRGPPRRGPGFYRGRRGRMMLPPRLSNGGPPPSFPPGIMNRRARKAFRGGRGGGMVGRRTDRMGKYVVGKFKSAIGKASVEPVKFSVGSTSSEQTIDKENPKDDVLRGEDNVMVSTIDEVIEELEGGISAPVDEDVDLGSATEATSAVTTPATSASDDPISDIEDGVATNLEDTQILGPEADK